MSLIRASILLLLLIASPAVSSEALVEAAPESRSLRDWIREGNAAYHAGDYATAAKAYAHAANLHEQKRDDSHAKDPLRGLLSVNRGAAAYQQGDQERAETAWVQGAGNNDPALAARNLYNLGTLYAERAETNAEADPEAAIEMLRKSLACYRRASELDPKHSATGRNQEIARQLLHRARLIKQQRDEAAKAMRDIQEQMKNLAKQQEQLNNETAAQPQSRNNPDPGTEQPPQAAPQPQPPSSENSSRPQNSSEQAGNTTQPSKQARSLNEEPFMPSPELAKQQQALAEKTEELRKQLARQLAPSGSPTPSSPPQQSNDPHKVSSAETMQQQLAEAEKHQRRAAQDLTQENMADAQHAQKQALEALYKACEQPQPPNDSTAHRKSPPDPQMNPSQQDKQPGEQGQAKNSPDSSENNNRGDHDLDEAQPGSPQQQASGQGTENDIQDATENNTPAAQAADSTTRKEIDETETIDAYAEAIIKEEEKRQQQWSGQGRLAPVEKDW